MDKTFHKLIQTRNVVRSEIKKSADDSEQEILKLILENLELQISLLQNII